MTTTGHADSRFAVYLIPPYQVARAVTEIHSLLRKLFGLAAADRFPVHAAIQGFFARGEGPLAPLVERLSAVFEPFSGQECDCNR